MVKLYLFLHKKNLLYLFRYFLVVVLIVFSFSCKKEKKTVEFTWEAQLGKIGNGVNLQPSYYNNGNVDLGLHLMKQYDKITTIRLEIEPFVPIETVKRWITEIKAEQYTLICTYHRYQDNTSGDINALLKAADWWEENYEELSKAGSFYINLMNEWGSIATTSDQYVTAYNKAIEKVRNIYQGPIILCVSFAGNRADVTFDAVEGNTPSGKKINDNNIILSTHIYGYSLLQSKANYSLLASTGKKCIVGEFGDTPGLNWAELVNDAKKMGWPVIGWAWNGDGGSGTQVFLNMIAPQFQAAPVDYQVTPYFDLIYSKL